MTCSSFVVRLSLVLFVGVVVACGEDGASYEPVPEGLDFAAVDTAVEALVAENELAGATMVIVHRDYGMVHLRGFGAFPENRISLIASSSKILSAGILLRLADRGTLDLDTPISTYLSEWGEYKSDILPAQLISNSSGMVGLIDNPIYGQYLCQYIDAGSLTTCGRTIYRANDAADRVPPDTQFRYGGGQWQLAGSLAEQVSGKTWDELVYETYTRPCDLSVLGYTNQFSRSFTGGSVENAIGYPEWFDGDPSVLVPTQNPNVEGGAYTTAEDYGKILLMHLRGGKCGSRRVLSETAVARMQEDRVGAIYGGTTPDPSAEGYGFGWWVSREHPGIVSDGGAYGASPWLDLNRGYGVMVIVEGAPELGPQIRTMLMPLVAAAFDAVVTE